MLGVILNEKLIIDNVIKNNDMGDNMSQAIDLLIKNYDIEGISDKIEIKENIIKIMKENDEKFNRSKWDEYITSRVKRYFNSKSKYKTTPKIHQIESIPITNNELFSIHTLKDKKLRKVAFILLVYAKISNLILDREDGWINQSLSNIFKEALVSLKGIDKQKLLHELYELSYISLSTNSKTSIKINYIDTCEESEIGINIEDFDGVIYSYLNYIGEKWKKCECGKWFKITSKTKQPNTCNMCASKIHNEHKLECWNKNKEKYRC